jgi:hypothetical protein
MRKLSVPAAGEGLIGEPAPDTPTVTAPPVLWVAVELGLFGGLGDGPRALDEPLSRVISLVVAEAVRAMQHPGWGCGRPEGGRDASYWPKTSSFSQSRMGYSVRNRWSLAKY